MGATGFAPLNLWPLTLVSLALLIALTRAASVWSSAALRGWGWGWGYFVVSSNWIAHAFTFQDTMPHWLGWVAVVGLAAYLALYPMLACLCAWFFRRKLPIFVLAFAGAWVWSEWLRATLLSGYAWDPVGVALLPSGLRMLAPFIGTYALSGVAVLLAALLLVTGWRARAAAGGVLVGLALVGWLDGTYVEGTRPAHWQGQLHVVIVQPNIPEDVAADPAQYPAVLTKLIKMSGAPDPHHARLIIWPEGSLVNFEESNADLRVALTRMLGPRDILLTGAEQIVLDKSGELVGARNALYALGARGEILGRYDKAHLVPGGEFIPLHEWLNAIGINKLVHSSLDFTPGPGPRTLALPGFGKMGGTICYEVIFSGAVVDRTNRPTFIVNPSTDAWFGAWGPPQHLAQAQMRALEEGVPVIRDTTTGISAVIDARGVIEQRLPLDTAGVIDRTIPPAAPPTLFSQWGNAIPLALATIFVLIAVALDRRTR